MATDPADNERAAPKQPRGLSPSEWALAAACAVLLPCVGLYVIVTRQGYAGVEFGPGPTTLDPFSAWYMGLALIAGGLILPLCYIAIKRKRQKEPEGPGTPGPRRPAPPEG